MSVATASYVSPTFISASAAAAGFGSGGGGSTDISALNTFTASIQTQVDNLTAETSSYLTSADTSSFILASQTSSMSVLSALTASFISDTFISASAARSGFGTSTLPSGVVSSSAQTIANLQGTGILSGSSSVPAGTISGSQQITDLGFINQSQTSSMSVATASYVDPTFISASAAAAGFGTATLPSGVVSSSAQIAVEISGAFAEVSGGLAGRITTLEGTSGGDVTALNLFTSSIQTQVNNLTAETSSYLTSADTSSFVLNSQTASFIVVGQTSSMSVLNAVTASYIDPTFISASAAASGFGSGGGASIPAGTISGSQQITDLGFVNQSQTSSMSVLSALTASFVGNLNYDYITNLPNLISSSTQIALLGAGILSASAQIAGEISGAFTSLSSSFASRITALEGAGGGSGIFTLTGSFYSTTNNLQITGSLSVGSGSFKSFEVDSDGFVVLGDMDKDLNNAPVGTIAYSGSDFYLIS